MRHIRTSFEHLKKPQDARKFHEMEVRTPKSQKLPSLAIPILLSPQAGFRTNFSFGCSPPILIQQTDTNKQKNKIK